jgi:hypothetical protein
MADLDLHISMNSVSCCAPVAAAACCAYHDGACRRPPWRSPPPMQLARWGGGQAKRPSGMQRPLNAETPTTRGPFLQAPPRFGTTSAQGRIDPCVACGAIIQQHPRQSGNDQAAPLLRMQPQRSAAHSCRLPCCMPAGQLRSGHGQRHRRHGFLTPCTPQAVFGRCVISDAAAAQHVADPCAAG